MIKIPYHKNLLKNLNKYPAGFKQHPCCICGKACPYPSKYMVWEHNGGGWLVTEEEAKKLNPGADLGPQPVGSDCWKKHPEIHKYRIK